MNAGKLVANIFAAILLFFGVLFIWGAFSPQGSTSWLLIGAISIAAGLGLIWLVGRRDREKQIVEVVQKVELSGDVSLEAFKCQSCGGTLSSKNVTMVAGAPVVDCPYCHSSYQLEEAPKW